MFPSRSCSFFFFFNDTATTEIYTLSLHDALPICRRASRNVLRRGLFPRRRHRPRGAPECAASECRRTTSRPDRKSTRLNSSHLVISYAVFCLKKKKNTTSARCFLLEDITLCQSTC